MVAVKGFLEDEIMVTTDGDDVVYGHAYQMVTIEVSELDLFEAIGETDFGDIVEGRVYQQIIDKRTLNNGHNRELLEVFRKLLNKSSVNTLDVALMLEEKYNL